METLDVFTWLLTCTSVTAVVLNIKKKRVCFLVFLAANSGWIAVNLLKGIPAQATLFVIYSGLSLWGFIEWGRNPPDKPGDAKGLGKDSQPGGKKR
ncbi:MAG: nicotinamide mononucleotide transporter [Thermodesulfobacteriota bacterium]